MDCDFSHNPKDIPRLIASPADLAIGSRYVKGGRTEGWPLKRKLISKAGGVFFERRTGYSKITFGIAVESFKMALRLRRG